MGGEQGYYRGPPRGVRCDQLPSQRLAEQVEQCFIFALGRVAEVSPAAVLVEQAQPQFARATSPITFEPRFRDPVVSQSG